MGGQVTRAGDAMKARHASARRITAILLACAAFFTGAGAVPDLSGPDARAFLGGRTGKLVYLKNQLRQIHYIDLSDSVLTERKVSDDSYCWSPMIHPDGTRIVYESGAVIYIRNLEENSRTRTTVYTGVVQGNHSLEPHWWIHPVTKDEYVIFTTGSVADEEWPPKSGKTYMQKIVGGIPSGQPLTLLPFMMASGRSKDGVWGGTSHHSTGMYKLYGDKVEDAFFGSTNWTESGGWGACNGSISPSKDPARQNRLMHLNSYLTLPDGEVFENHKAIVIRSYSDKDLSSPIWVMGIPGVRCNNDSSGNLFWDHSEWSTDEDYFTAVGTVEIENWAEGDVYVGRISYQGDNQIRRFIKGGGVNHYPHLWIKDGVSPARIRLDGSALEFVTLKQDTAGPPPDTIKVSNAGDGTLPSLKIGSLPAWLKVEIRDNGGNAPKLVVSVDRVAAGLGEHSANVKVSFGQLADSASFLVRLKYSDPVLTSLRPEPATLVLRPGDTARFRVVGLDQTGKPLPVQPAVEWKPLDSLSITAEGLVEADSGVWRSHGFRAVSGAVACTARVFVSDFILRVDAGAHPDSVPAGWIPDQAFAAAWPRESLQGAKVDLDSAGNPAPAQIYRTVRRPAGAYVLDSVPNGRYAVLLHFASPFPGKPIPTGKLAVELEGARMLEDYSLPLRPDSGIRGDTRALQATVGDGNGLTLSVAGSADAAALAGAEIYAIGPLPVALRHPNGGESFRVGDTLRVRWNTDGYVTSIGIQFSPDSGKSWIPVTRKSAVNEGQAGWGDYPWVIPDSLDGRALATVGGMVSVYDYFGTDRDRSDAVFSVLAGDGLRVMPPDARSPSWLARASAGRIEISLGQPGSYRAVLRNLRGRVAGEAQGRGPGSLFLSTAGLPRGVYQISLTGGGKTITRQLSLLE